MTDLIRPSDDVIRRLDKIAADSDAGRDAHDPYATDDAAVTTLPGKAK